MLLEKMRFQANTMSPNRSDAIWCSEEQFLSENDNDCFWGSFLISVLVNLKIHEYEVVELNINWNWKSRKRADEIQPEPTLCIERKLRHRRFCRLCFANKPQTVLKSRASRSVIYYVMGNRFQLSVNIKAMQISGESLASKRLVVVVC